MEGCLLLAHRTNFAICTISKKIKLILLKNYLSLSEPSLKLILLLMHRKQKDHPLCIVCYYLYSTHQRKFIAKIILNPKLCMSILIWLKHKRSALLEI